MSAWARRLPAVIALMTLASTAQAHGEEILVPIGAQGLTVLVVCTVLVAAGSMRRYAVGGIVGCLAGVPASWLLTSGIHYTEVLPLTLAWTFVPIVGAMLGIFLQARRPRP